MIVRLNYLHIVALTVTVSSNIIPVSERCAELFSPNKIRRLVKQTGVESLSIVRGGVCASDMCYDAAERLFAAGEAKREEIGAIIFLSQTPDYINPATSYLLQARLDLSDDVIALDVNLGCSGYVYGLYLAATMLANMPEGRKVLLCCGDSGSSLIHPQDTSTMPIMGDAGAATIIDKGMQSKKNAYFAFNSFGKLANALKIPRGGARAVNLTENEHLSLDRDNYTVMDGMAIMDFSLTEAPRNIRELLTEAKADVDEIDLAVFHQANKIIVRSLGEELGFPEEKVPWGVARIGNSNSSSIPACLAEMKRQGVYHGYGQVLLSGFGVGLSVASTLLNISDLHILETKEI
ncbi:MAG: ketoacyl-ACP synthase III [Selenomonas ruminantium]|nr:ketoacyl-ACP synthase III [Selenomonas ruminantium]